MVACREALDDGGVWSFYLINDSPVAFDSAVLFEVSYEWGDIGSSETTNVSVNELAPAASALIWRDNGDGAELRMYLSLRVRIGEREAQIQFEFPKLYNIKNLPMVDGLGKPGWQATAEAR
jgi:hypothetical protein